MGKKHLILWNKVICCMIACALVMVPVIPASAATARATTMKLEKTEGTVTLKTQNGTARKITNGMRLYNGNTLKTEKYSYAYVNLDNTKAVKLDQGSSATLRQSGKEMELLVKSGKIFFNVSKPLTEKEQMNVRTSTMVTGIRGTCGVVEYMTPNQSRLYLIEGKVTLGSGENATVVEGGQTATVVLQEKQTSGDPGQPEDKPGDTDKPGKEMEQKVMVEKLTEASIPPVALKEIVNDPGLQEKIEQTTDLKLSKIEEALEKFEKEEAERKEQDKAEQEKENNKDTEKESDKNTEDKKTEDTTPTDTSGSGSTYIPSYPGGSGGSGNSNNSGSTGGSDTIALSGTVSAEMINEALQKYTSVEIGTATVLNVEEYSTITIPGGKDLAVTGGTHAMPGTATIIVGDGTTRGIFAVTSGSAFTAGILQVKANSHLSNSGNLICKELTAEASTLISNLSLLRLSGSMNLKSGAEFHNLGTMNGANLLSDGNATVNNMNAIILEGGYILTTSGVNDNYSSNHAVLISRTTSSAIDTTMLLMTGVDSTNRDLYYYANDMCGSVVGNLGLGAGSTWEFKKDAVIPSGNTVGLAGFYAEMNEYALNVQGTLELSNDVQISGSGNATINLASCGNLILCAKHSGTRNAWIKNTGDGYAIAREGGKIVWEDTNYSIVAKTDMNHTIQNVTFSDAVEGMQIVAQLAEGDEVSGNLVLNIEIESFSLCMNQDDWINITKMNSQDIDDSTKYYVGVTAFHNMNHESERTTTVTLTFDQLVSYESCKCTGGEVVTVPKDPEEKGLTTLTFEVNVDSKTELILEAVVTLTSGSGDTSLTYQGCTIECRGN